MYTDDIKLLAKDERELETLMKIYSQDIGMEFSVEKWRLEETCSHSNSSERSSANADVKNSNE